MGTKLRLTGRQAAASIVAAAAVGIGLYAAFWPDAPEWLDRDRVALLYARDKTLCFWPDERLRCLWAETAARAHEDAFEADVYIHLRTYIVGGERSKRIARVPVRLEYKDDRLCEAGPVAADAERIGVYDSPAGLVDAKAPLRAPTPEERAEVMELYLEDAGREICFRYAEAGMSAAGLLYVQHVFIDGRREGEPDDFILFERLDPVELEGE